MPVADSETIDKLKQNVNKADPDSKMNEHGMDIKEILRKIFSRFKVEVLYTKNPEYKCSRECMEKALKGLCKDKFS